MTAIRERGVTSDQTATCLSCGSAFPLGVRGEACPECHSTHWVPDRDVPPDENDDRVSGSKEVETWKLDTHERVGQDNVRELRIETMDGWKYIFREPKANGGFELFYKIRSDGTQSEDDVVPVTVAQFIDKMTEAALNYAKLVVHPSDDVYTPPDS